MELKQSVINIILIIIFFILAIFVFMEKEYKIKSDISQEGEIFSASNPNETEKSEKIIETNLFGQEVKAVQSIEINESGGNHQIASKVLVGNNNLQEILFYSNLVNLPEIFIGKKTDNKDITEFSIYLSSSIAKITTKEKTAGQTKKQNANVKTEQALPITNDSVKAEQAKEVKKELDFAVLNKAITDSNLTFFYPYNYKTINDVSVGVLTITPYEEDQHIIKFEIKNNSSNFFIVANISVKLGGKQILARRFFDNVVGKKTDKQGILLTQKFKSADVVSITVFENGGKNRSYTIDIKIPI